MPETYSRVGSISIKKETTVNTAVVPDTFLHFNDEGITDDYAYSPATPVSSSRAVNRRAIINKIPAPNGSLNLNIEPKTFGHILHGLVGGLTSGTYFPITAATGAFTVGETVTGGTSLKTAVVAYASDYFLLVNTLSGAFTIGETITGSSSAKTATLGTYDSTVYGHANTLPANMSPTYTLQKNYTDRAVRYTGVRFHALDAMGQSDNILTAGIKIMAQGAFRHAKVTAITTSGAGAKTISVDSTTGIIATDSIKLYRPGTGFLDFSATSVKTHTIGTVPTATTLTITDLETATAVGDLIILAPQTASYTIADEFPWVGGSQASLGNSQATLSDIDVEDFTIVITNELEERHTAQGTDFSTRFPSDLLQKGLTGSGSFTLANENEDFYRHARLNTEQALKLVAQAEVIGVTTIPYRLEVRFAEVQFDAYQLSLAADDIVNEEVPFTSFYGETAGYSMEVLLVNDIASY